MKHRTQQTDRDQPQRVAQLFVDFAQSLQMDAKRFNEEHKKTKERIENGTTITKHRIAL